MFLLFNILHLVYIMLTLYLHLHASYSPENLFFLEDQVSQEDQGDPKSERQRDRERKKGMFWREGERQRERKEKEEEI